MTTPIWKSFIKGAKWPFAATNGLSEAVPTFVGESGPAIFPAASRFDVSLGVADAVSMAGIQMSVSPQLTTLVSFSGADGEYPSGNLIADAAGNLFGETPYGGADGDGTVFEIAKTAHGYANAPTTLVSFTSVEGIVPMGSLIIDAAGVLFGTTSEGGLTGDGTVFEIAKATYGYASAPTVLVDFAGTDGASPEGGLIADAAGNLFGATSAGGALGYGTVFEIAKTRRGYASAPPTLVSFTGADGEEFPQSALIADAAGDLFGTTPYGGDDVYGTVFEIAKTPHGYANVPITLVRFTTPGGQYPESSLIVDAAGDLFGTTEGGGSHNEGTAFEIAKTRHGYASAPTTIASFDGANGENPMGSLIIDAAGNLFGTTEQGLSIEAGTVFEIAKIRHGYASAPIVLTTFNEADGYYAKGGLIADAAGDLFGTAAFGGIDDKGTVFEISHSGYVVSSSSYAAFTQAMAIHVPRPLGSIAPPDVASRNEMPTLISLTRAA